MTSICDGPIRCTRDHMTLQSSSRSRKISLKLKDRQEVACLQAVASAAARHCPLAGFHAIHMRHRQKQHDCVFISTFLGVSHTRSADKAKLTWRLLLLLLPSTVPGQGHEHIRWSNAMLHTAMAIKLVPCVLAPLRLRTICCRCRSWKRQQASL